MVYATEKSEKLGHLLKLLIQHEEKLFTLKKKLAKRLYPLVVICNTILITFCFLEFIILQFQNIFAEFGTRLPPFTRFIII
ncbi:hypothetical protein [Coxiella-like endosymbiont]|uniref:hypothetical protein n=1 Tax=Coxiella-like endosymbiont TaxID=1592897 RepID=UPI00272C12C5|nr:hypothetical protein [Coxiella-like endosymbiont]